MGQLNIKDEQLVADAKALAELLGTSATEAIRRAVQEKLARERIGRDEEKRRRYDELMAIVDRTSKLFPPGTSSGRTFRLKGKGMPGKEPGDLYVTTRVMLPERSDSELEELMKKWRETKPYDPRRDMS